MSFPFRRFDAHAIHEPVCEWRSFVFRERPSVRSVAPRPFASKRKSWKFSSPPESFRKRNESPFGLQLTPERTLSLKNVSCRRSPFGIATSCTCHVSPKRVVTSISRFVGCQSRKLARRISPYGASSSAREAGIGGIPSATTLSGAATAGAAAGAEAGAGAGCASASADAKTKAAQRTADALFMVANGTKTSARRLQARMSLEEPCRYIRPSTAGGAC